jgi:hypothetical protein
VLIDGTSQMWIYDTDAASYAEYTRVSLDVSDIADGGEHEVGFGANLLGDGVTSYYVDAVELTPCGMP